MNKFLLCMSVWYNVESFLWCDFGPILDERLYVIVDPVLHVIIRAQLVHLMPS